MCPLRFERATWIGDIRDSGNREMVPVMIFF
jgi:hypothetical protein